jgi:hypothetical protein
MDAQGWPYAFMLSAGDVSAVKPAALLLQRTGHMGCLLGEKSNDASSLHKSLREDRTPVIPGRCCDKHAIGPDQ